jgi:hypothetical protein|tara:strand:- start:3985 stop:5835 length:1851 start_codon:yes stop_codon:yes gene_type:complete
MSIRQLYNNPDNFVFNSKDSKYSKDIRGGGFTGQPFVKRSAPETINQLNSLTTEALSLDFPIRGGSYEELAAREDFARIDRFLLSYPEGKAFLDKQKGLMFSNPKMETGQSGGFANTRAYSDGRNLMTQIAEGGTGFHHPNAGSTVNDLEFTQNKYEYTVAHKPTKLNRLVSLTTFKINNTAVGDSNFDTAIARELGINTFNEGELFFYPGGPSSVYGLGQTIIKRATDSLGAPINTQNAPTFIGPNFTKDVKGNIIQARPITEINFSNLLGLSPTFNITDKDNAIENGDIGTLAQQDSGDYIRANRNPNGDVVLFNNFMGYDRIRERQQLLPGTLGITDFRNDVINSSGVAKSDYTSNNITTRVGVGDPGARPANLRTKINDPFIPGQDFINTTDIQTRDDADGIGGFPKDLVKFAFETINNDKTDTTTATFFRAFLTGYSDSHNAEWSPSRYTGRGENFYTYQGFDRTVNFNFKVAAQSKQEMKFIYKKLNYLLSTLHPDYNTAGFMRGNITKLTIGDLFVRTPGILESLQLSVDDQYAWEIAMGDESKDMLETPQIMDVGVQFKPILNVLPRTGISSPILITDPNNKYLNNRDNSGTLVGSIGAIGRAFATFN